MPEEVEAGTFDNAYTFYQKYKNDMAFQPGSNKEGEIYYATCGKKAVSSGTQYATVGWKVTMKDNKGKTITTLYYQLGGKNMVVVDTQLIDGYEYILYRVTLENMRNRISDEANEALKNANCSIVFDACLTLKINGVLQGGMTDSGPSWGTVYTTYNGIVNAADWSSETRETLKTYFAKNVEEIYYTVVIHKGTGIESVSGAGKYCFGTWVTVTATLKENYSFLSWTGDGNSVNQSYMFALHENMELTANGSKMNLVVKFYKEDANRNFPDAQRTYYNDNAGQALPDFHWKRVGYHQTGWSLYPNAEKAMYSITNQVWQNWIDEHIPSVNLYAVWQENSYIIEFSGNGGTGKINEITANYSNKITLPEDGFVRDRFCICGWSTDPEAIEAEYKKGEEIELSVLVEKIGLEYSHNEKITLYAVWDNAPVIVGDNIYASLEDAKNGVITEEWLSQYVRTEDVEDGEIPFGVNETSSFTITNYEATDFTTFKKEGAVTETFRAIDSNGNVTEKIITVHIVDANIYEDELIFGKARFISEKYYKSDSGIYIDVIEGGLYENSVWRLDENYRTLLESVLQ